MSTEHHFVVISCHFTQISTIFKLHVNINKYMLEKKRERGFSYIHWPQVKPLTRSPQIATNTIHAYIALLFGISVSLLNLYFPTLYLFIKQPPTKTHLYINKVYLYLNFCRFT